jgi:hypothetical protein
MPLRMASNTGTATAFTFDADSFPTLATKP